MLRCKIAWMTLINKRLKSHLLNLFSTAYEIGIVIIGPRRFDNLPNIQNQRCATILGIGVRIKMKN